MREGANAPSYFCFKKMNFAQCGESQRDARARGSPNVPPLLVCSGSLFLVQNNLPPQVMDVTYGGVKVQYHLTRPFSMGHNLLL